MSLVFIGGPQTIPVFYANEVSRDCPLDSLRRQDNSGPGPTTLGRPPMKLELWGSEPHNFSLTSREGKLDIEPYRQ